MIIWKIRNIPNKFMVHSSFHKLGHFIQILKVPIGLAEYDKVQKERNELKKE